MSGALKALLVLAVAGALVSAVFAFLIIGKKNDIATERDQIKATVATKDSEIKKVQSEITAKTEALTAKEKEAEDATKQANTLKGQLSDAEKKVTTLQSGVSEAEKKVADAEAQVKKINEALEGKTPQDLKTEALQAQEQLTAVKGEQKILQDQLQAANAEVTRVTELLRLSGKNSLPPGVTGKIETVNRTWNFVVLNVGDKDGVVRNGTLIVYRANTYVGKVRVVSTEAHTAVADILPEWSKADIQAGDDVLN